MCSSSPPLSSPRLCSKHSSFADISQSNDVDLWITLMHFGLYPTLLYGAIERHA